MEENNSIKILKIQKEEEMDMEERLKKDRNQDEEERIENAPPDNERME
jgi:hypothetical protein